MHDTLRGNSGQSAKERTQQQTQQERQERQKAVKTMLAYALLVDKQKAALLRGNYLTAARLGQQLYYHASEAYMAALDLASLSLRHLTTFPTTGDE